MLEPDLDAAEYEALTGIAKAEYERRFLRAAAEILIGSHLDGDVESVTLGGGDEPTLDAVVRANHVPGRRFGWRIPVWPAPYPSPPYTDTIDGAESTIDVAANGRTLNFVVPTCHGRPTTRVVESGTEIHLLVTSDTSSSDKCADSTSVTLDAALGSRAVVDDKTGKVVVTRRAVG